MSSVEKRSADGLFDDRKVGASLRVENVKRSYGNFKALDDVSLSIREGELMAFLGPSGSGKTTLLNIIAGFESPSSGEVYSDGMPITGLAPNRRDIGMVFQHYTLFPHMSVYHNVEFPLKVRNFPASGRAERVHEVLRLVRMKGTEARRPSELSGGQQQRVALARGLVYEPRLILMDEPLGALDKKLRDEIQDEIKELHQRLRVTIIYVTHDQDEALRLSDRITILNKGKIEQTGTPQELYHNPASLFVAEFMGNSSLLKGQVEQVEAGSTVVRLNCGTIVRCLSTGNAAAGQAATIVVRQEQMQLSDAPAPGENSVAVTVEQVVFLGGLVSIRSRTSSGNVLTVKAQNLTEPPPAEGAKTYATWSPDATMIFY